MKHILVFACAILGFNSIAQSATCYKKTTKATELLPALVCYSQIAGKNVVSIDKRPYQPVESRTPRTEGGQPIVELTLFLEEGDTCSSQAVSKLVISPVVGNYGVVESTPDWCHSPREVTETAEYVAQ